MDTNALRNAVHTKEMLQDYRARWEAVAEIEAKEQRAATFTERWRKLNTLLGIARELGLEISEDEQQVEIVRERWNRLRTLYLSSLQEQKP